ncbi:MAG: hypothetical protein Q8M07_06700 [Prosthecobacter sp.]|nr:hypothetical protein [Prosthecobacter sp.]HBJ82486.1 TIGR02646 family protein [Verrucomicrobiales bacterium]
MRTIKKRPAPASLVTWRQQRIAAHGADGLEFTYEAMRRDDAVVEDVEDALHGEQGALCAYTGRRIQLRAGPPRKVGFHLEHLKPQQHCEEGEDTDYNNLVACWPEPNSKESATDGAVLKGNWPSPAEEHLFVSPLRADCTARFQFGRQGQISAAQRNDPAAEETIRRLGLDHRELTALRKAAILGALQPCGRPITLAEVEKLRREMDQDEQELNLGGTIKLRPFCFAVRPQLESENTKLQAIRRCR